MNNLRLLVTLYLLILWGCARITTPMGGPMDKKPAKLVSSNPADNEKNFKAKNLSFEVDEAVVLKEPKEEIIISPSPGKDIEYVAKQNKITIEPKLPWKDSTTYSVTFREAIRDLTEANITNLRIAFSTGPIIDTLKLAGAISDALTEKIPEKITVALFQSDTFSTSKHIPSYFTQTDEKGHFIITNLKKGSYRIYAFDDKSKNLKLETKTEKFGFISGRVNLTDHLDSLRISLVSLDLQTSDSHKRQTRNQILHRLIQQVHHFYKADSTGNELINTFADDQTRLIFYHPLPLQDSIPVKIHAVDSLDQQLDTILFIKTGTGGTITETFKPDLKEATISPQSQTLHATITLNKPLQKLSLDSVLLKIDTLNILPITKDEVTYDTIKKRLEITKKIPPKLLTTVTRPVTLSIARYSIISIDNDSSKMMTKRHFHPKTRRPCKPRLEIQTTRPNFEVQLLTTDYKLVQSIRNQKKVTFKNIVPAEYKIRVYVDVNNNHQWDPGNINKDIPPEPTYYFKNADGKYPIPATRKLGGRPIHDYTMNNLWINPKKKPILPPNTDNLFALLKKCS